MLLDLAPSDRHQYTLDLTPSRVEEPGPVIARERLMVVLDQVNGRYGRGTMLLASAGLAGASRYWIMKQERMTPNYTTRWSELALVKA